MRSRPISGSVRTSSRRPNAAGIFGQHAEELANDILGIPTGRHDEISTTADVAAASVRSFGAELAGLGDRSIRVATNYVSTYSTDYLSQASPVVRVLTVDSSEAQEVHGQMIR